MLIVALLACGGPGPSEDTDPPATSTGATGASTGATAETGTPTPPEGWVLRDSTYFASVDAVTVSVASNASDATFVLDVIRGGEHELWLHTGRWWLQGAPPVQLMDDDDATDVFVPSIRGRDGVTHVLARTRCDRNRASCLDPGAMLLTELEVPDGWDGLTALVERPITEADGPADGQSQLVPEGGDLHVCHTVHELGDEVECRTRATSGSTWSPGIRVSGGAPGADDHPYAFLTSGGDRLVGHTTSQSGERSVRLLVAPGAAVDLQPDFFSDWLTLAEEEDGTWLAMWAEEPTATRQIVLARCAAGSPTGCGTRSAWDSALLDPDTAGSQNHPNLAGAPGAVLAAWERTEPGGGKRIRFATVCASGEAIVADVDPRGDQSKIYGFPGMVYEPATDTAHLAYVRDQGAGFEVVWASLYHPAGACP